jgi:hypothetical protein
LQYEWLIAVLRNVYTNPRLEGRIMIARASSPLLMMLATAASAAVLPLKPGTYVLSSTPCGDPAFAAMFDYDGRSFSYPHATNCRSVIRAHAGRTYHVSETCSALGDGSASVSDTRQMTYTIVSDTRVRVSRGSGTVVSSYRRCAASLVRKSQ